MKSISIGMEMVCAGVICLAIQCGLLPTAQVGAQEEVIGYWDFEDGARDASGYGNDGVLSGPSSSLLVGGLSLFGSVLSCDGQDFVEIPHSESFNLTDQITVSAWINVRVFDKPWQAIVTKGDSAWALHRDGESDAIRFSCRGLQSPGGSWEFRASVGGADEVVDGQWHHVAGVYDGQELRLYLDGQLDASVMATGTLATNDWPIMIGENAERPGRGFEGLIDEVRIYDIGLRDKIVPPFVLFRIPVRMNLAPFVDAGRNQTVNLRALPSKPIPIRLTANVADEGGPNGSIPTYDWSVVDGPGPVDVPDPGSLATTVYVYEPGTYVFEMAVSDGQYTATDLVTIDVLFEAQQKAWSPGEQLIRSHTPAAWQEEDVTWTRDLAPRNKIDDLIDTSDEPTFSVVINFRRTVTVDDETRLGNMSRQGRVQKKLKYISSVAATGYTMEELQQIASDPDVASIELQSGFGPALDDSVKTIGVTPEILSECDGTGVTIVVMDSGVDNTLHRAYGPANVAGYDAMTGTVNDPGDIQHHGTHVASIALGREWTADLAGNPVVLHGVAPGARLIDVRVPLEPPGSENVPKEAWADWTKTATALEEIYDRRHVWDVNIINMSIAQRHPYDYKSPLWSNGMDAFSQLVDLAESMGIVVVAAAGNWGKNVDPPNLTTPAAATRAITVAAWRRSGKTTFSSPKGPRADDGDEDHIDELKPEVTAPGSGIEAAFYSESDTDPANGSERDTGTSQAAPHVSGLAALIMQKRPGINAASVKDLIIATSDWPKTDPYNVNVDPTWNEEWGWGLVDAEKALASDVQADVTFPNHPSSPSWLSPDIAVKPFPFKVDHETEISTTIRNNGPDTAYGIRVHFGVHTVSAMPATYDDIGTALVEKLEPDEVKTVAAKWKPRSASHLCFHVEIGYGFDSDYANNTARRSLVWAQSPTVWFPVRNIMTEEPSTIELEAEWDNPDTDWEFLVDPLSVTLGADDPPHWVKVQFYPPEMATPGSRQLLHLAASLRNDSVPEETPIELGGISISGVAP